MHCAFSSTMGEIHRLRPRAAFPRPTPSGHMAGGFALCLLLMSLLFTTAAQAQELRSMTITPDENPSSGVPLVPEYPDAAYIIINSNISNLAFSSNMNGIIEERNIPEEGIYRLIIQPFTQFITVTAPGFMQGRFRVPAPDSKQSLFYKIEAETSGTNLVPVNFIIEGADRANLLLDGQEIDYSGTVQLDPGPYELRIEQSGYRTIEADIVVSSDNTLFRYTLEQLEEETVTIRSTPPDATVYINGIQWGSTTFEDFFFPGDYLLRLTKEGYRDMEAQIIVEEDGQNEFSFELERFAGTLQLNVVPANAQVQIGGRDFTRQQDISLPPGTHRIVVEQEGYYPVERIIEVEQAQQLSLDIRLEPRVGTIRFATESPDARFRLFDSAGRVVEEWRGINLMRDIPIGRYEYRGQLAGYRELVGQMVVRENETTRVDAVFTEDMRDTGDERRKRELEQERQADNRAQPAPPPQRQPTTQQRTPRQRSFSAPRNFTGYGFTYSQLDLDTSSFTENISENIGLSFSIYNSSSRFWVYGMHFGYNQLSLDERFENTFESDKINVLSYSFGTGPKLGLGPFHFFAMGGIEGNALLFDGFEEEEHLTADVISEFGVIFAPAAWRLGFRYSMTMPLEQLEGDPVFTRREIGIIIK